MAKQKPPAPSEAGAGAPDEAGSPQPPALVRFTFLRFWSSDRGVFQVGETADLPREIAASLEREGVGAGD